MGNVFGSRRHGRRRREFDTEMTDRIHQLSDAINNETRIEDMDKRLYITILDQTYDTYWRKHGLTSKINDLRRDLMRFLDERDRMPETRVG